jgi:hypothetical protein
MRDSYRLSQLPSCGSSYRPGNHAPHIQLPQRPRPATTGLEETSAPETFPLTGDLHRWAADTVPGLSLKRERDKFLGYARVHGLIHVGWSEALKFWWLEAHARFVRRYELQHPAVARPTTVPGPPPVYDVGLHTQIKADIARLCGPAGPSLLGTSDYQEPR